MEVKRLKFTLLNHLFYYTEIAGRAASATGGFIGDLALNYALRNSLRLNKEQQEFRRKPYYEEIREFGFYCTIAKPLMGSPIKRTENYIRNTLFNVDGYPDVKAIEKSGKSPFKNFRQVQGITVGSTFTAVLFSQHPLDIPTTIRIGTGKETLVLVEEIPIEEKLKEEEYWLNAFSLKVIFNHLDEAVQLLLKSGTCNFNFVLEQYNLIKKVSLADATSIFKPFFDQPPHH